MESGGIFLLVVFGIVIPGAIFTRKGNKTTTEEKKDETETKE